MVEAVNKDTRAILSKALLELKKSQRRIEKLEKEINEQAIKQDTIAIIGMGCRFPGGADSPDKLWNLLRDGKNLVSEIPPSRWKLDDYYDPDPGKPGKMYTKYGYFLDDIEGFDREFFNISPAEAKAMDPQHRLLLETTWEALEYAGYSPKLLRGSNTGVFIGSMNADYSQYGFRELDQCNMYTSTTNGNGLGVGRISHNFGFTGPAMAIDTLCSSSLTGIHLAVRSLQNHECDLAVSGGVNLMLTPGMFIITSASNMLAADGLCKTFDDTADGYARGECCGVIVLKRLSDARRDNDNILAVIKGSAVNQDGASSALPVPNGLAQEKVIREALKDAKLESHQVDYVEVHGTGTSLGDPIEVETLDKIFGSGSAGRADNKRLSVGSIKTNFGHTEGAAGVAGLLKVILSMKAKQIPPHLNVTNPSSHIPWSRMKVDINTKLKAWEPNNAIMTAGVSSFGLGGTNVHIILQNPIEEPTQISDNKDSDYGKLLTLSAKTHDDLKAMAQQFRDYLTCDQVNFSNVCYTSNVSRSGFQYRSSYQAQSKDELIQKLQHFIDTATNAEMNPVENKTAFVFTGLLTQASIRFIQDLYDKHLAFKPFVDQYNGLFETETGVNFIDLLWQKTSTEMVNNTSFVTMAHVFLEISLAEFWQSLGVLPLAISGIGKGEYAAACFSRVMTPQALLSILLAENKSCEDIQKNRNLTMIEMQCDLRSVKSLLRNKSEEIGAVKIASINTVDNIWLVGEQKNLDCLEAKAKLENINCKPIGIIPDNLSLLLLDDDSIIQNVLSKQSFHSANQRIVSSQTGQFVQAEINSAAYWQRKYKKPIKLKNIFNTLHSEGIDSVLQIGDGWLSDSLMEQFTIVEPYSFSHDWHARKDGQQDLVNMLSQLWEKGISIDWKVFFQGSQLQPTNLPFYPFNRNPYWLDYTSFELTDKVQDHTQDTHDKQTNVLDKAAIDMDMEILNIVADVGGIVKGEVKAEHGFVEDLGYDSMMIMELKSRLQKGLGGTIKIDVKTMMKINLVSELINFIKAGDS